MNRSELIDEAHGDDVVALTEQALGNVVATRGILIIGVANLLAIQIGDILVEERTEEQTGRLTSVGLINGDMLTQPDGACASPTPIVLIDLLPRTIVKGGRCPALEHARVVGIEDGVPLTGGLTIGTHLGLHVVVALVELGLPDE